MTFPRFSSKGVFTAWSGVVAGLFVLVGACWHVFTADRASIVQQITTVAASTQSRMVTEELRYQELNMKTSRLSEDVASMDRKLDKQDGKIDIVTNMITRLGRSP